MPGAVFMRGERVTLNTIDTDNYGFVQEQFNDPAIRRQAGVSLSLPGAVVAEFVDSEFVDSEFVYRYRYGHLSAER